MIPLLSWSTCMPSGNVISLESNSSFSDGFTWKEEVILVQDDDYNSLLLLVLDCDDRFCGNKGKDINIPRLLGESNIVRSFIEDGIRRCGMLLRRGFCC